MAGGPWGKKDGYELSVQLSELNSKLLKIEDIQRDVLFELKELNDSQTNQTKTISNLGVPIWLLTFMALAAFWKLGWWSDFWYELASFF